jgi:magnesium chelatase family protein
MISRVHSFVLQGIDAISCEIEADLSPVGLPKTTVVGLPDVAVKESMERVRTAILNSGFRFPQTRITINLAPADVKKEGPVYDLPFALALLRAEGAIEPSAPGGTRPYMDDYVIAGELALDGRVRPIKGVVSLALLARQKQARGVIVPIDNAAEAAAVADIEVLGVKTLGEVGAFFNGQCKIEPHHTIDAQTLIEQAKLSVDFGDIRGQEAAKRAMTIAAAGGHNILMIGPTLGSRPLAGPIGRSRQSDATGKLSLAGPFPLCPC